MDDKIELHTQTDLDSEKLGGHLTEINEKLQRNHSVAETLGQEELEELEVAKGYVAAKDLHGHVEEIPLGEGIIAEDDDVVIDPRLKDYPIPLVARTVDLRNDPT